MDELITKEEFNKRLDSLLQLMANKVNERECTIGYGYSMRIEERNDVRCIFSVGGFFSVERFAVWYESGKVYGATMA